MNKNIASYEYAFNHSSACKGLDWFKLIEKKDFKSALEILEKKNELSVPEKLWWIRCQLNLKLLPASTLVSPLEQTYDKTTEEEKNLSASTYLATCKSLINRKQSRLSVLTSKKAFELLKEQETAEVYKDCLKNEIKDAREKKQKTSYISELETELEKLEKSSYANHSTNEYTLGKEVKKDSLDQQSNEQRLVSIKEDETTSLETTPLKTKASKKVASKRSFPLGYILAGLLFILLGLSYNFIFTKEENLLARIDYNIKVPQPLAPNIKIDSKALSSQTEIEETNLSSNSSLKDVEKRITSLNTNEQTVREVIEETVEEVTTDQDNTEKSTLNSNNINSNIDSTEDYSEEIDLEPIPKEKIPDISPRKTNRPELIEQSPRRVAPSLPKASKGIKTYDVEEFDPALKYRTITSTEVLSAPSLLSNSLARLNSDTHILVVKKIGLWLEIRSTQGNIGYIYAQDASEL